MLRVEITRSRTLTGRMEQIRRDLGRRMAAGLSAAGQTLLELSRQYVPVDTGTLLNSGIVRQEGSGLETAVTVGYGRSDMAVAVYSPSEKKYVTRVPYNYALHQHETHMEKHSYLLQPRNENQAEIRQAFRQAAGL